MSARKHAETSAAYWTRMNVTEHHEFTSLEDSLNHFEWRNSLYSNYIECMPVDGADGLAVLDYGCGPGHDLVGFISQSKPSRLIGMDVSPTSLAEAASRLQLHDGGADVEFMHIEEGKHTIPLPDASMDLIHSSGVLHHIVEIGHVMSELRRLIKNTGYAQIMVYNYNSIFAHIEVKYLRMMVSGLYPDMPFDEVFKRCTDGPECPVSRAYRQEEFAALASEHGFEAELVGAAISTHELQIMDQRYEALKNLDLPLETRRFINALELDSKGRPCFEGNVAGLDACYRLTPV